MQTVKAMHQVIKLGSIVNISRLGKIKSLREIYLRFFTYFTKLKSKYTS